MNEYEKKGQKMWMINKTGHLKLISTEREHKARKIGDRKKKNWNEKKDWKNEGKINAGKKKEEKDEWCE